MPGRWPSCLWCWRWWLQVRYICFHIWRLQNVGLIISRPNISPLMVEQLKYSKMRVVDRRGERIILDPALTTQRIFMYFYLCINIGSIVGQVTMVYAERYVGFWLSYTLPTIMFCFCPLVLAVFHKRYTHYPPTESVLGNAVKLIKFACKGKVSWNPRRT